MRFYVVPFSASIPIDQQSCCYLRRITSWNDWFKYCTVFELVVFDESGTEHSSGSLKIGARGMDTTRAQVEVYGFKQTPFARLF